MATAWASCLGELLNDLLGLVAALGGGVSSWRTRTALRAAQTEA